MVDSGRARKSRRPEQRGWGLCGGGGRAAAREPGKLGSHSGSPREGEACRVGWLSV